MKFVLISNSFLCSLVLLASGNVVFANEKICGNPTVSSQDKPKSTMMVQSDKDVDYSKNRFVLGGNVSIEKSKVDADFLKAELILVEDKQLFMELWNSPSDNVQLNTIDTIDRNKPFYAYIIFEGCKRDVNGKCTLSLGFMSLFPNGETDGIGTTSFVLKNAFPPAGQFVSSSSTFRIGAKDVVGEYAMVARIYDANADAVFELRKCFQVR